MRPVAVIRFSPSEGPGRFGDWLDAQRPPVARSSRSTAATPCPTIPKAFAGIGMMGGPMGANDPTPWRDPLAALRATRRRRAACR